MPPTPKPARPAEIGIPFDSADYLGVPLAPLSEPIRTLSDGRVIDLSADDVFGVDGDTRPPVAKNAD
jgi:hypothetical protein